MNADGSECKRWQAARITVWFAIIGATVGFWAGAGALVLRWLR